MKFYFFRSSLKILINSFAMEHDAPRGIVVVDCATHASQMTQYQGSICRGVRWFTPHWLKMTPHTGDWKFLYGESASTPPRPDPARRDPMSNDKPRLRFSTIGIQYRQNHGGWHHHSSVSPREDSLTHTTRQSSSSVLGGFPVPQLP